ncbi:hypothetical protein [Photobacterium damselae]|uniref:hypothetical protein n=1 Tax=Photobacterium damselae TaxID=38293 RepID=UPI0011D143AB|nr:hypothetical protein [Photobacterium damselae]KAB1512652.1 hypothetical protein FD717_009670 [Photobacterium damselae subsp. damselae]
MKVLEKNQVKVLETEKLLREVITDPTEFKDDEELVMALKSQSAIAKYQNKKRNIAPCSLNTVKSISETLLVRGFLSLDELRINAKEAIDRTNGDESIIKGNKQSKSGLERRVAELELELDVTRRSNFLLTAMVSELRSKLKQLANHEGTVEEQQELYREHNRKIEAQMNYTLNGEV